MRRGTVSIIVTVARPGGAERGRYRRRVRRGTDCSGRGADHPGLAALDRSRGTSGSAGGAAAVASDLLQSVVRSDGWPHGLRAAGANATLHEAGVEALFVLTDALVLERHLPQVTALALQSRLPAIYPWRMYSVAGGLMVYGSSLAAVYRRAASYVDRLLKSASPADLLVE